MAKISLSSILSGFLSQSQLNKDNRDLEAEFQNKILYRDNPVGEPNAMQNNLDMNSNKIINLPDGASAQEPATKSQLDAASTATVFDASISTYTPAGAGAVSRTVSSKLNERVSVEDFGAIGDGVADDTAAILAALASGSKLIHGGVGKIYLISSELVPPVGVTFDLTGSIIKADINFPNTDNFIKINTANVTVKGGEVDGNKANLLNMFTSGITGCGVLVTDGGDNAKVLNMHTHDVPQNGQICVGSAGNIDNVLFEGYRSNDNAIGGIGAESGVNGTPITKISFLDGETADNNFGGDIRIQGVDGFLVSGHTTRGANHAGCIIGTGEQKNVCKGSIVNTKIGNDNVGLPTLGIDGLVGGVGPFAGQKALVEVTLDNVELNGPGANNGILAENDAIVIAHLVTAKNHAFNYFIATGAILIADGITSRTSSSRGIQVDSMVELNNVVIEEWGSATSAILFTANADDSICLNARLGARLEAASSHDGGNNVAVMTDSTASFIVDEHVGKFIRNITDGSQAMITANTATTVTGVLAGGTDDDWDTNDLYEITLENGGNGIGVTGTPSNITMGINGYTGTGLRVGGVAGAVLNTWELKDLGAQNVVEAIDGIAAPAAEVGRAKIYVDVADGDLKVKFGDGFTAVIAADS